MDEYDAPANLIAFEGFNPTHDRKRLMDAENFFGVKFFSVLKEGCGSSGNAPAVSSKYFITGVLPAFRRGMSPLQDARLVSNNLELHGICGFTEDEVRTIVRHYLRQDGKELD